MKQTKLQPSLEIITLLLKVPYIIFFFSTGRRKTPISSPTKSLVKISGKSSIFPLLSLIFLILFSSITRFSIFFPEKRLALSREARSSFFLALLLLSSIFFMQRVIGTFQRKPTSVCGNFSNPGSSNRNYRYRIVRFDKNSDPELGTMAAGHPSLLKSFCYAHGCETRNCANDRSYCLPTYIDYLLARFSHGNSEKNPELKKSLEKEGKECYFYSATDAQGESRVENVMARKTPLECTNKSYQPDVRAWGLLNKDLERQENLEKALRNQDKIDLKDKNDE